MVSTGRARVQLESVTDHPLREISGLAEVVDFVVVSRGMEVVTTSIPRETTQGTGIYIPLVEIDRVFLMKMMISGNNVQLEDLCCKNSAYNISTVHISKQLSDILSLLIYENNHLFSMGTDLIILMPLSITLSISIISALHVSFYFCIPNRQEKI